MSRRRQAEILGLVAGVLFLLYHFINFTAVQVRDRRFEVLVEGQAAPPVRFENLNTESGERLCLPDQAERVIVLSFWSVGCLACVDPILSCRQLVDEWGWKGLAAWAVNVYDEDLDAVTAYVGENGIDLPVGLGGLEAAHQFAVRSLPVLLVIDREGVVAKRLEGADALQEDVVREAVRRVIEGAAADDRIAPLADIRAADGPSADIVDPVADPPGPAE